MFATNLAWIGEGDVVRRRGGMALNSAAFERRH